MKILFFANSFSTYFLLSVYLSRRLFAYLLSTISENVKDLAYIFPEILKLKELPSYKLATYFDVQIYYTLCKKYIFSLPGKPS